MQVFVRLFGDFRRYLKETSGRAQITLSDGATVQTLLDHLGIVDTEVGLVSVNGNVASSNTILHEGDQVDVFSPIGGGAECPYWHLAFYKNKQP